jgi:hypothetical protein
MTLNHIFDLCIVHLAPLDDCPSEKLGTLHRKGTIRVAGGLFLAVEFLELAPQTFSLPDRIEDVMMHLYLIPLFSAHRDNPLDDRE